MTDYTDTPIGSGYNTNAAINTELDSISTAIASKLDKAGDTMTGDLDMNSNQILNLPAPIAPNDVIRLQDLNQDRTISIGVGTILIVDSLFPDGFDKTTTDTSSYFNTAFTAAEATGARVEAIGGDYLISNTVRVSTHCNLENVDFLWDGGTAGYTGTTTSGSSATVLTDATAAFPTFPVGSTVLNRNDGGRATIVSNTATTITVSSLTGGTLNTWEAGDTYVVREPYEQDIAVIVAAGTPNALARDDGALGTKVYPDDFVLEKTILLGTISNTNHVAGDPWANQGIGLRLGTVLSSKVGFKHIRGFTQGINAGGTSNGFAYNIVEGGEIINCLEGLVEDPILDGWCNQNLWSQIRIAIESSHAFSGSDTITYGTTFHKATGKTGSTPNGNLYVNFALEGRHNEYTVDTEGVQNIWQAPRLENAGSLRGVLLARNSKGFNFKPVDDGTSKTFSFTITPIGGSAQTVTYTGTGNEKTIIDAMVESFNSNSALYGIAVASVYLNLATNSEIVITAKDPAVGFTFDGTSVNGIISDRTYAVGSSGNLEAATTIVFRGAANRNRFDDISFLFSDLNDTNSVDNPGRVLHLDSSSKNFVGFVGVDYDESSSTDNEGSYRFRNSSSTTATHSWYQSRDDMYASENLFTAAAGSDGFGTKNTNTALDLELEMRGKALRFNHYEFNDAVDDTQATMSMVRLAQTYPGGFINVAGSYNDKAVYGDVNIEVGGHDAATSSTVMTDSSQSFGVVNPTGDLISYAIINTTDGSIGDIVSNTATTITVEKMIGGVDNDFDNGDIYEVRPYQALGVHTGGASTTVMTDGLSNWETNRFDGYKIFNITQVQSATITSSTATTVTHGALTGGASWAAGDAYMIQRTCLDRDNFNGMVWDNPFWNGALHKYESMRMWLDTKANLRQRTSDPTKEDEGYILARPRFDGGTITAGFAVEDGDASRVNASGGDILITMPTVKNQLTSQFFIRDESGTTTSTFAILEYDSLTNIMGDAANYKLNVANASYSITYVGGTLGYLVEFA